MAASKFKINFKSKVYGRRLGIAVAVFCKFLGFEREKCVRTGFAFIFMKFEVEGQKAKIIWLGNPFKNQSKKEKL